MEMEKRMKQSSFKIYMIAMAMAGVQFVYAIQFAVGGPLLQDQYKLSASTMSIILTTAGALSGFFIQPIVGVYSDTCTSSYGRRRPFIFWGTIFCVIGMAFVGNSVQIGQLLGDNLNGSSPQDHKYGLTITIIFLWVINFAVNAIVGPARALVSDLLPAEQQQQGSAIITLLTGATNIVANIIGAQFLNASNPYRWLFIMGCIFTFIASIPTLLIAKEVPYAPQNPTKISAVGVFKKIGVTFVNMPNPVTRIFIVFFSSWAAYTPFLYFITTFFAENVKGYASLDAPDAYKGVQLGMYALAVNAAVSLVFSFIISNYIHKMGIRTTYFVTQIVATACYALLAILAITNIFQTRSYGVIIAVILTALVAVNFTSFNSIPFALLFDFIAKEDSALYMGVLNTAATTSQVFTNLIASQVILPLKNQDIAWAIGFGAVLSLISSALVVTLKTNSNKNSHLEEVISEKTGLIQRE